MSRRTVPRICKTCGQTFLAWDNAVKQGYGKYCSHRCRAKHCTGEANPNWKGGKILRVCQTCGRDFLARKTNPGRFCSNGCTCKSRIGEVNPNWKGDMVTPQKRAKSVVGRAIKNGKLTRQPCERCGSTRNVDGHHDDYNKPLAVEWLCRSCHWKEHRGIENLRGCHA